MSGKIIYITIFILLINVILVYSSPQTYIYAGACAAWLYENNSKEIDRINGELLQEQENPLTFEDCQNGIKKNRIWKLEFYIFSYAILLILILIPIITIYQVIRLYKRKSALCAKKLFLILFILWVFWYLLWQFLSVL